MNSSFIPWDMAKESVGFSGNVSSPLMIPMALKPSFFAAAAVAWMWLENVPPKVSRVEIPCFLASSRLNFSLKNLLPETCSCTWSKRLTASLIPFSSKIGRWISWVDMGFDRSNLFPIFLQITKSLPNALIFAGWQT